ncbi:uncharacterized protein [Aegilops tauschii subsp. strangulata]
MDRIRSSNAVVHSSGILAAAAAAAVQLAFFRSVGSTAGSHHRPRVAHGPGPPTNRTTSSLESLTRQQRQCEPGPTRRPRSGLRGPAPCVPGAARSCNRQRLPAFYPRRSPRTRHPGSGAMADHSDGPAVGNPREDPTASEDEEEEEEEGEGFTFAAAARVGDGCAIGPVYLVFGRPRSPAEQEVEEEDAGTATVRVPLRQLLLEERGSSSSSPGKRADEEEEDDDELDGVPAETYCLWSPGTSPSPSPSPSRCQKSGSTGSVLRWRQRLQVGRSHSDGKEKFVFLQAQQDAAGSPGRRGGTRTGESRGRGGVHGWSHRGRGGSGRGSPGRRASTFLPYKQDLLGLFANAGAFRRSYHPF